MARTMAARDAQQMSAIRAKRRRGRALFPAGLTLALWRVKPMWGLLVVLQLGLLTAVMLLSAVPLFSRVATAAGLEGAVRADPLYARYANLNANLLVVDGATDQPTTAQIRLVEQRARAAVAHHLSYLSIADTPTTLLMTSQLAPLMSIRGGQSPSPMALLALPSTELADHTQVLEGRLPRPVRDGLEIVVTSTTCA
jgi:hypothetical protein